MLNPDTGLHPSDKERGVWYYQYINRIEALVEALRCAGFAVNRRALGPRGGNRWVLELTDHNEARGLAYSLRELYSCWGSRPQERQGDWEDAELLVSSLPVEQFDTVARLRGVRLGNKWELISLARCVELVKTEQPAVLESIERLARDWWGTTEGLIVTAETVVQLAAKPPEPTRAQRRELDAAGISVDAYLLERKAALTHREILGAYGVGATHPELMQAHRGGMDIPTYTKARGSGVSHSGLVEAHKSGMDLDCYAKALSSGATTHVAILEAHGARATGKEILEVCKAKANLHEYASVRRLGYPHKEILVASTTDMDPFVYCRARRNGATHREVLAAREAGTDMSAYIRLLSTNSTHAEALLLCRVLQMKASGTVTEEQRTLKLVLGALRSLHTDGPATPAELEFICEIAPEWVLGPVGLAEAARHFTVVGEVDRGGYNDGKPALKTLLRKAFASGGHQLSIEFPQPDDPYDDDPFF
jgi:hypothetical protein